MSLFQQFLGAIALVMGSVLAAESPPKSGTNSEQNAAIDVVDSLLMVTSTAMPASLPESTALKVAEPLPIAEAHVSAQIQMASAGSDQIHSGGPKFRKAAESSTREMPATSTVSPTAFLVNDNARDNRGECQWEGPRKVTHIDTAFAKIVTLTEGHIINSFSFFLDQ